MKVEMCHSRLKQTVYPCYHLFTHHRRKATAHPSFIAFVFITLILFVLQPWEKVPLLKCGRLIHQKELQEDQIQQCATSRTEKVFWYIVVTGNITLSMDAIFLKMWHTFFYITSYLTINVSRGRALFFLDKAILRMTNMCWN